jgi:hypothetical protein
MRTQTKSKDPGLAPHSGQLEKTGVASTIDTAYNLVFS